MFDLFINYLLNGRLGLSSTNRFRELPTIPSKKSHGKTQTKKNLWKRMFSKYSTFIFTYIPQSLNPEAATIHMEDKFGCSSSKSRNAGGRMGALLNDNRGKNPNFIGCNGIGNGMGRRELARTILDYHQNGLILWVVPNSVIDHEMDDRLRRRWKRLWGLVL